MHCPCVKDGLRPPRSGAYGVLDTRSACTRTLRCGGGGKEWDVEQLPELLDHIKGDLVIIIPGTVLVLLGLSALVVVWRHVKPKQ